MVGMGGLNSAMSQPAVVGFEADPWVVYSWVTALVVILVSMCVWGSVWAYRKGRKGPKGWPMLGDILEMRDNMHRTYDWFTEYFSEDNKTWSFRFPNGMEVFNTVDPVNVEYILASNFKNFGKGKFAYERLADFLGEGIFVVDGDLWRRHRKVASAQFSTRKLRDYSNSVFREDALHLVHLLQNSMAANEPVEFQGMVFRMTIDGICKVAFGKEMGCCSPALPEVAFANTFDAVQQMAWLRQLNPLWKLARALDVGLERRLREGIRDIDAFAANVIAERRADIAAANRAGKAFGKEDLLSKFMEFNVGTADSYSDSELRDMIISFLLAGRDTTAVTLSWFVYRVCCNPEVAEKIYKEGVQIIGKHKDFESAAECLQHENLSKMHYLHAAINETLRLDPPVPKDGKIAFSDDVLPDGTKVRKGDMVQYVQYSMGRMPFLWGPDALEFKPERWLRDGILQQESPFKFTAFQAGPRICLGKESAYLTLKVTLALIFHFFTFKLVPGHDITYGLSLVTPVKDGLHVTIHARKHME